MDLAILWKVLVMGIVEGLTEFLPISSTGHLIIVGAWINYDDEKAKVFDICIQLGAILAVCWEYRSRLVGVVGGLTQGHRTSQQFVLHLLLAFLPAAVLGLLFHKTIKTYLFSPITVAVALIVGGIIILWVESRPRPVRLHQVDDMRWQDALKIGFAQSLALFPGVSRAGATIIGGMCFGLSRQTATQFSFFLAIPTMFAATGYDLLKHRHILSSADFMPFAVGFVAAFLSAMLAVKGLLRFVAHHDFKGFAWYRIGFGSLVLSWYLLQ